MGKAVITKPGAANVITDKAARDVMERINECRLLVKYLGYDQLPKHDAVFDHDKHPAAKGSNDKAGNKE